MGISEGLYHAMALGIGLIAGIGTMVGVVLLIYRRRTTGPVFMATTRNDKLMYVVLVAALFAGLATTLISVFDPNITDYRETVSPWFRSIFIFQPDIAAMTAASLSFKIHTLWGLALFAIWPFTRLVHAFTAPLQYIFRPYIVYRSRGKRKTPGAVAAAPRLGSGRHAGPGPQGSSPGNKDHGEDSHGIGTIRTCRPGPEIGAAAEPDHSHRCLHRGLLGLDHHRAALRPLHPDT